MLYEIRYELPSIPKELHKSEDDIRKIKDEFADVRPNSCLLYTSPSPRDRQKSRMPSSA